MLKVFFNSGQFRDTEPFEDLIEGLFDDECDILTSGKPPIDKLCYIEVRAYNLRGYTRQGRLIKKKVV